MSIDAQIADREALERFKEEHPELGSVRQIVSQDEEQFVRVYAAEFSGGSRQARQVYRTAVALNEKAILIWANIKDAVASPHFRTTLFNNIPDEFIQHHQSIPGYDRLFGSLNYVDCDHCRSIFGPAAYFVDLMRFVENHITTNATNQIPAQCRLEDRRPDLFSTPLDCANTNDLIPYIDLVLEVLELFIRDEETLEADPYQRVENSTFPMTLPFNVPLTEMRRYLKQLKTSLHQIYTIFATDNTDDQQAAIAREFLELSPHEFNLLVGDAVSPATLSAYYGIDVMRTGANSLENVSIFLQQTGLTRKVLNDLLFQDLDRHEVNAGLSRLFFINTVDDGLGYLAIAPNTDDPNTPYDALQNLSPAKLDRIYRFLKLSRKLDWSFADLDTALRSLQPDYVPETILHFDGINDFVACQGVQNLDLTSFTLEAWINPTGKGNNPILCKGIDADADGGVGNTQTHFLLWLDSSRRLAFYTNQYDLRGSYAIPQGVLTHVAVTVSASDVRFYINGKPESTLTYKLTERSLSQLSSLPATVRDQLRSLLNEPYTTTAEFLAAVELAIGKSQLAQHQQAILTSALVRVSAIAPVGSDLNIGKDLGDEYFAGLIKDVRIWQGVRSAAAIDASRYVRFTGQEPGLVGYWTLNDDPWTRLTDRTANANHGSLGGDRFVAQPTWVRRDLVLDAIPTPFNGSTYQFNGVDHYLAGRNLTGLTDTVLTVEAWIRLTAQGTNPILAKGMGTDDRAEFLLWVNSSGNLVFEGAIPDTSYVSTATIPVETWTHVAVALSDTPPITPKLYINAVSVAFTTVNVATPMPFLADLNIGRNLGADYFAGSIREVRLWNRTRSGDQIALTLHRPIAIQSPGLIGYWPMDGIGYPEGMEKDLSFNQNHLMLGGILEDYMPARVMVDPLLPSPIALPGTVLRFDGENDVIAIDNLQNRGLGRYERLTLELWFNATDAASMRQQIIYSQGDAEAGLAVYLTAGTLNAIAWCNSFEQTDLREFVLQTSGVESEVWYHLAVVVDEFPAGQPVGAIAFRAYLNGIPFPTAIGLEDTRQFQLSPVGMAYLGGIAQGGITRLQGAYSGAGDESLYFFAGQMTDVRLWKRAKAQAAIEAERFTPPALPHADLIAYLPMTEAQGGAIADQSGNTTNPSTGILQSRNVAFVTDGNGLELDNVHSHYADAAALTWTNYTYTGRFFLSDGDGGIGVTCFSRYPENQDRYYLLRRYKQRPTLHLVAYPPIAQGWDGTTDSNVNPAANTWYRFRLEVASTDSQTTLRARIWQDGTDEPTGYAIAVTDSSPTRLTAGTVGVWAYGEGVKQFDDLKVIGAATAGAEPTTLLYETFEMYDTDQDPEQWKDTGDRVNFDPVPQLFQLLPVEDTTAFGTTADLQTVFSHYTAPGVLNWTNYLYSGTLLITDADSAIGVTFFSRYPEQQDRYYSLRRDRQTPTFQLIPHGIRNGGRSIDSGITPQPSTWYHFRIEVENIANRTALRAKIWQDGTPEPREFQIQAHDNSANRLTAGTVGVLAADAGSKYFQNLVIDHLRLSESFATYSVNQHPDNWTDTKANFSREVDNSLFKVINHGDSLVFGTQSTNDHIHSHYTKPDALTWTNYTFTGRMLKTEDNCSIGVNFLSRYPTQSRYYRLRSRINAPGRRTRTSNFELVAPPQSADPNNPADFKGTDDSGVPALANVWYHFWIEVEVTDVRTNIRAKVWKDGDPEPAAFQIDAYDDSPQRLTAGTVGIWGADNGSKLYDDLRVFHRTALLPPVSPAAAQEPMNWTDTGTRNPSEETPGLFKTVEFQDNAPWWRTISDYPVLLHPLTQRAVFFDGQQEYLAAALKTPLTLSELTVEAWIQPDRMQENPVLSVQGTLNGQLALFRFGLSQDGKLKLAHSHESTPVDDGSGTQQRVGLFGATVVAGDRFTHIAVTVQPEALVFYVNGDPQELDSGISSPIALTITDLDVGRDTLGHYFSGWIKELRIWSRYRSAEQIAAGMYQRPNKSDELVGYWAFDEAEGVLALDTSEGWNDLRLGGVEGDRHPVPLPIPPSQDFWRPDRTVLAFASPADTIHLPPTEGAAATIQQRRTVELWFRVQDKTISQRKQVLYHQGDGDRGLILYIYDNALYFGGYNLPATESDWQGTWMVTDRIESAQWHHVALVLDGRPEVRPISLRAYLDGKLADVGDGSQLWQQHTAFTLGNVANAIRFHDGLLQDTEPDTEPFLVGQIMDVRLWHTARTETDIANNRYGQLSLPQAHLILWWQFDTLAGTEISDLSGNGHVATLADPTRLQPIGSPTPYALPVTPMTDATLISLADIKALIDQHSLSIDKLTALWGTIKHTGREDQTTLFDQVFNPAGVVVDLWSYYLDQPIRWDVTGQGDQNTSRDEDRQTRARLMGALQVSHDDLNHLVRQLSGEETVIELDTLYLTQLYRLARTAVVLGLSIKEFLYLLDLLDLNGGSIDEFRQLRDRALWMQQAGFTVYELDFLANDTPGNRPFAALVESDIRDLADTLRRQSTEFLATGDTFISDEINQARSIEIFTVLDRAGLLDNQGAVAPDYVAPADLTEVNLPAEGDRRQKIQAQVDDTLSRLRDQHINSVLSGLATFFDISPDLMQVAIAYFQPEMNPNQFIELMLTIGDTTPIPPAITTYLYKLAKVLYLVNKFGFSPLETSTLLHHPDYFSVASVLNPTILDLEHLYTYQQLRDGFGDTTGKVVNLLSQASSDQVIQAILALTNWEARQLHVLMTHFGTTQRYNRVGGLSHLKAGFDLAQSMGVSIEFLVQLTDTTQLDLSFYYQQSAALLKVLRARYDDEQWTTVYKPIRDALAVQKRDALLSLALLKLGDGGGRRDADILYEFLLIDPQIGSEVDTSRIVQATASVQLYVQRCLMSLEKGVNPQSIPADQWEWMKNYRVWEANRKVFLYPENYIEPELRQTKTPLFEELEQALMQTDVNQVSVEQAYTAYLDKFREIANLKIVGSYLHSDRQRHPDRDEILYLVGRTDSQPRIYYYRTQINGTRWTPWQRIELTINADFATPVFAFNRLFLFWVELTKMTRAVDAVRPDGNLDRDANGNVRQVNVDVYQPAIKYSYYNFSRSWIQPQTYLTLDRELSEQEHLRPEWQRVYAQRSLELMVRGDTPSAAPEQNARVLQVNNATRVARILPPVPMTRLTWMVWVNGINQNAQSTAQAEGDARSELVRSLTLFSYSTDQLVVTLSNTISQLAGVAAANTARLAARTAATAATAAAQAAAAAARSNDNDQAAQNAANTADQHAGEAETAAGNTTGAIATNTRQAAAQARQAATQARQAATAAAGSEAATNAATAAQTAARLAGAEADEAERLFNGLNKWQSTGMVLGVQLGGTTVFMLLENGWHHVAISLNYQSQQGGYAVSLYRNGVVQDTRVIPSGVLGQNQTVAIAPDPTSSGQAFRTQISDFCVLDQVADAAQINAMRGRRKTALETVLYLPLNRQEPDTRMTLVASTLAFARPTITRLTVVEPERERIITFYGNIIRTLRNNLVDDQLFQLTLQRSSAIPPNYDLDLSISRLHVALTDDLSAGDYAAGDQSSLSRFTPAFIQAWSDAYQRQLAGSFLLIDVVALYRPFIAQWIANSNVAFNQETSLLQAVPRLETALADVGNQPGWYVLSTGDEQFLIKANVNGLQTTEQRLRLNYGTRNSEIEPQPVSISFSQDPALTARLKPGVLANDFLQPTDYDRPAFTFTFDRLSTFAVHQLSETLFAGGLDALLSVRSQQTPEHAFSQYQPQPSLVDASRITPTIDFNGAYGLYYREIFFHIPFLIANKLNANRNFADAQRWYHYIFNPTAQDTGLGNPGDRYWQFLPFRNLTLESLDAMLSNEAALAEYRNDPFDPHAIAQLRINAYQKAIVMKYIDNLLDWGDDLFTRDTRESINEAAMLYVLAFNLLGPKPEAKTVRQFEPVGSYRDIRLVYDSGIPEFLSDVEATMPAIPTPAPSNGSAPVNPHNHLITDFCVMENEQFISYWDRVQDRLFKIRHSLNIEGVFRQLALFEPPINPAELVRAIAGGRDIGSVLSDLNAPVPHYRYAFLLDKAKDLVSTVTELGASLQAALESRDAAQLELLQNTHEQTILNLTTALKRSEWDEAQKAIEVLRLSQQGAQNKKNHFDSLVGEDISGRERAVIGLLSAAQGTKSIVGVLKALEGVLGSLPSFKVGSSGISSPVVVTEVNQKTYSAGVTAAAEIALVVAEALEFGASMAERLEGYRRRLKDWQLEQRTAENDLQQIAQQIQIAQFQFDRATRELAIHDKTIEQNRQIAEFYRSKFSNQALYNWMVSRLSGLYFQAYRLAYDMAKAAEKALQYELASSETFISFGHWDSLRKGLLAGESLTLELNRMDKHYLDRDSRFLQVEKVLSLKDSPSMRGKLDELKRTGACEFHLTERLFDEDYPGHYCRLIKVISISITIPDEVNLLQSVNATVFQLGNKTLLKPDIKAVRYLMGMDGADQPDPDILRVNWRANQQIAISRAMQNSGMFGDFELNILFDERYFPFEGTGAISSWRLEVPKITNPSLTQFDLNKVNDVIIQIQYTAKSDNGTFKTEVQKLLKS